MKEQEDGLAVKQFLDEFCELSSGSKPYAANRLLFTWLSDDRKRRELLGHLANEGCVLKFQSRANKTLQPAPAKDNEFHQDVYLFAARDQVTEILGNQEVYSNSPFSELGVDSFMLGLDWEKDSAGHVIQNVHYRQRHFVEHMLNYTPEVIRALSTLAFEAGALLPLKTRNFDLAELAFQVASHYVRMLFGFSLTDQYTIVQAMQASYMGLNYQIFGRHFVTQPSIPVEDEMAMGPLLERAAHLLDLYRARNGIDEQREYADLQVEFDELRKMKIEQSKPLGKESCCPGKTEPEAESAKAGDKPVDCKADRESEQSQPLLEFEPVMRKIARRLGPIAVKKPEQDAARKLEQEAAEKREQEAARTLGPVDFSSTELAIIVVGLMAATVGSVQASICNAIKSYFEAKNKAKCGNSPQGDAAEADSCEGSPDAEQCCNENPWANALSNCQRSFLIDRGAVPDPKLERAVWAALKETPPVPYLTRKTKSLVQGKYRECGTGKGIDIPAGANVLVALGAAAQCKSGDKNTLETYRQYGDPRIFGWTDGNLHSCVGQSSGFAGGPNLVMPLITHVVRQIILLPDIAETLDPQTAEPVGLVKPWGFFCERYPLEFNRDRILSQSPLILIQNIKSPTAIHAEAIKQVIKYGAPAIEQKLRDANHIHFAWFLLLDNDTKLCFFSVYDRQFESYIEQFALQVGPLFDLLFEHIENAPPSPVKKFPKEFIDAIWSFNNDPLQEFFFSAYPTAITSMICDQFPRADGAPKSPPRIPRNQPPTGGK
jgi:hypothetical protein